MRRDDVATLLLVLILLGVVLVLFGVGIDAR
jgi:hypothetical protein